MCTFTIVNLTFFLSLPFLPSPHAHQHSLIFCVRLQLAILHFSFPFSFFLSLIHTNTSFYFSSLVGLFSRKIVRKDFSNRSKKSCIVFHARPAPQTRLLGKHRVFHVQKGRICLAQDRSTIHVFHVQKANTKIKLLVQHVSYVQKEDGAEQLN